MTSPNTFLSEKTALGTHATQDKTPLEMLYQWEKNNPSDIFLRQSLGEKGWEELTWQQVSDQVRRVANYIKNKNLPDSSNIAIWSTNNVDWVIVDLAIMLSGHVSVPLYPGQSVEGVQYILAETECQLIFLGECHQEHQIDEALPDDVQRIGIRGCKVPCHASLSEVISESQPYAESPIPGHDQLMTIVYSSGTGGNPKGVTHVHGTPAGLTPILARIFGLTTDEGQPTQAKLFSFLPLSHMAERGMVEMTALYSNAPISFSAGLESFNQEIQEVQPTFFFAVPRLWHKFKSAIESKLGHLDPERLPDAHKAMIRQQLGLAEAHFIISASAPIPTLVQKWFLALGIVLREAYGMTETFSSGCCWYKDNLPEAGSVGTAHEGAEIKLSEEGEVLMRSKGMMTGYYKNPQLTAEVLTDGWFHTGDLGQLDSAGNLRITGRVGSIFKNSKGKFVNPEKVEKHFQKIKEFEQLVLIGEGLELPILVATLSEQAREESIERLQTQITTELDEINSNLAAEERVSKIIVVPEDWNIDNGFLTPTLKLKRKKVATHYHPAVSSAGKDEKVIFLGR